MEGQIKEMTVYKIDGVDYLHIQTFANVIGRSQQSTRHLIEDGNSVRRLKAWRDGSRLMIPLTELTGYPFVNQGKQLHGKDIYHYVPRDPTTNNVLDNRQMLEGDVKWSRELCEACTYTLEHCKNRQEADALNIPEDGC